MSDKAMSVEDRLARLEQAVKERQNITAYEPIELTTGAVVFRSLAEPFTYACANCHANGRTTILDRLLGAAGRAIYPSGGFRCPVCKALVPGAPKK